MFYQHTQPLVTIKLLRLPTGMNTGDKGRREVKGKLGQGQGQGQRPEARPVPIAASEVAGEEVLHFLSRACPFQLAQMEM